MTESRVSKPASLILLISFTLLSLLASFMLGTKYAATDKAPAEQANATVPVWVTLQKQVVSNNVTFQGTVRPSETVSLVAGSGGMVLKTSPQVGDTLSAGDLLGIVDGKPIFVLDGPLPLYRELHLKDRGEDVRYLQEALARIGYYTGERTGKVDEETLSAVAKLYKSEGLENPGQEAETIDPSSFVSLPQGNCIVLKTAAVASLISADNPLVTLEQARPFIEANISIKDSNRLQAGQKLKITTSKGSGNARLESLGEFVAATDKTGATYRARIETEDQNLLVTDQSVSVSTGEDEEALLALPSNALREDSQGSYVEVQNQAGSDQTTKVYVKILREADGYVAIESELSEGTKVLLS